MALLVNKPVVGDHTRLVDLLALNTIFGLLLVDEVGIVADNIADEVTPSSIYQLLLTNEVAEPFI
jgi:hypothetical protein